LKYKASHRKWGRAMSDEINPGQSNIKVLLREPFACKECGQKYLSLYALKKCEWHAGLEEAK
jgi:hypothetical protein